MSKLIDLTGQKFGRLTVIEFGFKKKRKTHSYRYYWKCKCECGNIVMVEASHLKGKHTKSCGCLAKKTSPQKSFCRILVMLLAKIQII